MTIRDIFEIFAELDKLKIVPKIKVSSQRYVYLPQEAIFIRKK
jgi:hypothetical protein